MGEVQFTVSFWYDAHICLNLRSSCSLLSGHSSLLTYSGFIYTSDHATICPIEASFQTTFNYNFEYEQEFHNNTEHMIAFEKDYSLCDSKSYTFASIETPWLILVDLSFSTSPAGASNIAHTIGAVVPSVPGLVLSMASPPELSSIGS